MKIGVMIAGIVNEIILETGLEEEVLMDNITTCQSEVLKLMMGKWNIRHYLRVVYRPNGILKWYHQVIKAIT